MPVLYIIKVGSTFSDTFNRYGDFDGWVINAISPSIDLNIEVIDALLKTLPSVESCAGIIVTGSHAMVTDELPWSCLLESWLKQAFKLGVPILGVCYGHQLLAKAMGGVVANHPRGPEIGCLPIFATSYAMADPLFARMPPTFNTHLTHHQSVVGVPSGAIVLAANEYEPVQAFRVGACAWGVQFHPEYSTDVMKEYLIHQRSIIDNNGDGGELAKRLSQVQDTPVARSLIMAFVNFCSAKV